MKKITFNKAIYRTKTYYLYGGRFFPLRYKDVWVFGNSMLKRIPFDHDKLITLPFTWEIFK